MYMYVRYMFNPKWSYINNLAVNYYTTVKPVYNDHL